MGSVSLNLLMRGTPLFTSFSIFDSQTRGGHSSRFFIASEHQEIRFYLISVHDKLFGQHLLFDDRLLYQELKAEGKADEIEKWLEAEMTTFRTGRLQNEA